MLRADSLRYFSIYGVYGISVFAARGVTVDELAQRSPLVRFEVLTVITRVLRAAGFDLEPTGHDELHFTLAFTELDSGVAGLLACEHETWRNPYHEE